MDSDERQRLMDLYRERWDRLMARDRAIQDEYKTLQEIEEDFADSVAAWRHDFLRGAIDDPAYQTQIAQITTDYEIKRVEIEARIAALKGEGL